MKKKRSCALRLPEKLIKDGGVKGGKKRRVLAGLFVLQAILARLGLKGKLTAAVQGFGNVGITWRSFLMKQELP